MFDNPFSEEIFPNIQSKPPLLQLEALVPSAAPRRTCALDPSPALLLFSGHATAPQCRSWSEGPKLNTGREQEGVRAPTQPAAAGHLQKKACHSFKENIIY